MQKHFTIGQLASIFQMDVQLLRHYDSIGLLSPAERNEQNNYRLYDYSQLEKLATIRYLRKLGYSLKKIEEHMHMTDYNDSLKTLQEQSEALRQQSEKLLQIDTIIQKKIAFIRKESQYIDLDASIRKSYPERQFVMIGEEKTLFSHDIYYFHPPIVLYQNGKASFGAYLFEDSVNAAIEDKQYESSIITLPAGRYLCGYHGGEYRNIQESIDKLIASNSSLQLDDCVIAINIIDQFIVSDISKYRTEIQLRILED